MKWYNYVKRKAKSMLSKYTCYWIGHFTISQYCSWEYRFYC